MKRKLLVSLIAVVVIAAIVGSCFAVYSVSDSRSATIGVDSSSVRLSIGTVVDNFTINNLQPDNVGQNQTVVLTTLNNVALIENGAQGLFKVEVAALDDQNEADLALASAIIVSATDSNSGNYNAAALASGVLINLKTIPQSFTVNYKLPVEGNEFNFMTVAEGQVQVTISWLRTDFTVDDDAYYLVGAINGKEAVWNNVSINAIKLTTTPNKDISDNQDWASLTNVRLDENDVIKGRRINGGGANNAGWFGSAAAHDDANWYSSGEDQNVVIKQTGLYNVYINKDAKLWIELVQAIND